MSSGGAIYRHFSPLFSLVLLVGFFGSDVFALSEDTVQVNQIEIDRGGIVVVVVVVVVVDGGVLLDGLDPLGQVDVGVELRERDLERGAGEHQRSRLD